MTHVMLCTILTRLSVSWMIFVCVCVCPYFYFIFFDFVLRFFLFNFEREKKTKKTWPLKKRKEDDGSSGGGHVKKRVELHELRLLCLWWLRPDRRRPSFVYPALSSGNPDLPFPSPTPLHPRTCQRQTTLRTQHCAFSFKSADSTMHAFKMYNIKASGWLEGDIFTCPFTVAIVYRAVWSKEVGIDGRGEVEMLKQKFPNDWPNTKAFAFSVGSNNNTLRIILPCGTEISSSNNNNQKKKCCQMRGLQTASGGFCGWHNLKSRTTTSPLSLLWWPSSRRWLLYCCLGSQRAFFFLKTWTREGRGRVKKNNSCTPTKALLLLGLDDYP